MITNKNRYTDEYNIKTQSVTGGFQTITTSDILNVNTYILASEYRNITTKNTIKISNATPNIHLIDTNITRGSEPTANNWNQGLQFRDKNNSIFGALEHGYLLKNASSDTNDRLKENRLNLIVYRGTTTDTSTNAQISVGFDKDGKWFTYAPTPANDDNSSKIATTAFIKRYTTSKDFINSFNATLLPNGGIVGSPLGNTWVKAAQIGKSFISSTPSTFGSVFNAKTKTYRIALSTWPGTDDNVYLYSITDANINSTTNSVAKSMTWNANDGTLTYDYLSLRNSVKGKLKVEGNHGNLGTGIIITGGPQNYAISIQNANMVKGTKPTTNAYSGIDFYGKAMTAYNKDRLGLIQQSLDTTNTNVVAMYAYKPTANTNTHAHIAIKYDSNKSYAVTNATLPAASDNSTNIATTKFVQNAITARASNATPKITGKDKATAGTSTSFARADHSHAFKLPSSDTAEFKELMQEMIDKLHLQWYIGDTVSGVKIDNKFYVSPNGNNKNDGRTPSKPFATINYALSKITSDYNINSKTVYVYIAKGTYKEQVVCPQYTRTTGTIVLVGCSDSKFTESTTYTNVKVTHTCGNASDAVLATSTGSIYTFKSMTFELIQSAPNTRKRFPNIISVGGNSTVTLNNCKFIMNDIATGGTIYPEIRCLYAAAGSKLIFTAGGRFAISKKNSLVTVIYAENGANVMMYKNDDFAKSCYFVSGVGNTNVSFDIFYRALFGAMFRSHGSATYYPRFVCVPSETSKKYNGGGTGKKYKLSGGSGVSAWSVKMTDNGTTENNVTINDSNLFPGNSGGSVESYSWYV